MDELKLRSAFLAKYHNSEIILGVSTRVADFHLTKEIFKKIKGQFDKEMKTTNNRKGLVRTTIIKYKCVVNLDSTGPETEEKTIIGNGTITTIPTTKIYETGYKHYLQGNNKPVSQLYTQLASNIPDWLSKITYPGYVSDWFGIKRYFTKEESHHSFQTNELFSYCHGFAVSKFVTFLEGKWGEVELPRLLQTKNVSKGDNHELLKTFHEAINPQFQNKIPDFVNLLRVIDKPAINENNVFIGRDKGVISIWFNVMEDKGIIEGCVNDSQRATIVNSKFEKYNVSASHFRTDRKRAKENYKADFKSAIAAIKAQKP